MRISRIALVACAAVVLIGPSASSPAMAADLDVVGGQLVGAFNVDVDGVLYNVTFVDGSCVSLFGMGALDCQSVVFTFGTQADAIVAGQALLDEVFIDGPEGNFDTSPNLTAGCTSTTVCAVATPYSNDPPSSILEVSSVNINSVPGDLLQSFSVDESLDTSSIPDAVFALWTLASPPPVPSLSPFGIVMFGSVLGLFGWRRLSANRFATQRAF